MSNLISKLADVTSTWGNLQCHKGCLPDLQSLSIAWTGEGDKIVKAVWSRSLTGWQLVDTGRPLTTWQNWNDGLVERRPCPLASAWRRLKESAWSAPFAHEPWARAVPVGEFLGSRMPAGHVSRRDRWPCSDVDVFPPDRGWRLLVPWRH